jgi:hypothetical protein
MDAEPEGADGAAGAEGVSAASDTDDDEGFNRRGVDWAAHPPLAILARAGGDYLVARAGRPLHEAGAVPAAAAAALRAGGAPPPGVPPPPPGFTLALLEDWDAHEAAFRRDVHDATLEGASELGG